MTTTARSSVLCFDGQSTSVECGELSLPAADYTVEGWFQARSAGVLFEAAGARAGVAILLSAEGLVTLVDRPAPAEVRRVVFAAAGSYRDGRWHHLALVKADASLSVFMDGVVLGSVARAAPLEGAMAVVLGKHAGARKGGHLKGELAEVRVWGRALTAEEIRAGRARRATGSEPGLLRCWRLNEGYGKPVRDAAGNAAGTVHGQYVWSEQAVPWAEEPKAALEAGGAAEAGRARRRSQERDTASENTTGLEDYGRWKQLFESHDPKSDPPFRRGRIWA